jgi:hypothetical protein
MKERQYVLKPSKNNVAGILYTHLGIIFYRGNKMDIIAPKNGLRTGQ